MINGFEYKNKTVSYITRPFYFAIVPGEDVMVVNLSSDFVPHS
jgi:hypothetical protein